MEEYQPLSDAERGGPARHIVPRRKPGQRLALAVKRISWAYLIVLMALWGFQRFVGDRWWVATLMLFGPMWVTILPAALLAPAAALLHRRSLLVLLAAAGICLFPLMGLCLPWRAAFQGHAGGQRVRLLTCNIHGGCATDRKLADVILQTDPGIIVLQEFPPDRPLTFLPTDYPFHKQEGELLVASRFPIRSQKNFGEADWTRGGGPGGAAIRYDIELPSGIVHLFNLHLASPHLPFQAVIDGEPSGAAQVTGHLAYRRQQSEKLSRIIAAAGGNVLVSGDFNTPGEGSIYRDYWGQFSDAFAAAGVGLGWTYHADGAAVRIDHVLMGSDWQCTRCWVGPKVGSPHQPVIAELEKVTR